MVMAIPDTEAVPAMPINIGAPMLVAHVDAPVCTISYYLSLALCHYIRVYTMGVQCVYFLLYIIPMPSASTGQPKSTPQPNLFLLDMMSELINIHLNI